MSRSLPSFLSLALFLALAGLASRASATPANRTAFERHYDRFLARPLASCTTCHLPSDRAFPESLDEFPHNAFGQRLREWADLTAHAGRKPDWAARLGAIADEDSDGDGVANQTELLLGHQPGDARDRPTATELARGPDRQAEFGVFLRSYRWRPFDPVVRPGVPEVRTADGDVRNPIDAFLAAERSSRGLKPRPEAGREVLLRRVFLDLIGLSPTPAEQQAFLEDTAPGAYERCVDRLLEDPRHGERWARHWMDVWRYSDWAGWTDGGQIRDSQRHIWQWRDWIVEALNADLPYDRMVTGMLAADEVAPEDVSALRATGFLARNYKMLSREQWLEDTVKHVSQALVGVTIGCAKCHDHMADPVSQREYYGLRAIFEPHQVRTDRLPGELDVAKAGLPRVYDATNTPTYLLVRGDERHPLTNEVIAPSVPRSLGGRLEIRPVPLPWLAGHPDHRDFVIRDTLQAAEKAALDAKAAWARARSGTNVTFARVREAELEVDLAEKKFAALVAVVAAERAAGQGQIAASAARRDVENPADSPAAATHAVALQRGVALSEAMLRQHQARTAMAAAVTNKVEEASKRLAEADQQVTKAVHVLDQPLDEAFTPRPAASYPSESTGRRSAFARWLTDPDNPLLARVAVNHVWLRHFGRGLVPTPADFGRNGRPPTHPELLDWLAAEFQQPSTAGSAAVPWSFRHLHRLIVTSAAYRQASTPEDANLAADPDNQFLWRMNSHRLEAEAVRDNLLYVAGTLDATRGGPDIDHLQALTSPRRSLYLRHAAEKQAEFLQIFDGPAVTECYERRPSVMPQQALALSNSDLALKQARTLAARLISESESDAERLVDLAFQRILARRPNAGEGRLCADFLGPAPVSADLARAEFARAAENLVLVLFNHNDFVTVR